MIPTPPPVDTGNGTDSNPNLDAIQSAIRFPLFVALFGILVSAFGQFVAKEEWIVVAGGSLVFLGFLAWGLLKMLYGGEIKHKQK